jgi:hypothetical protein
VRKEFWLDPKALRRAQTILGAGTERETVELALDLVAFRQELGEGLRTLAGLQLDLCSERTPEEKKRGAGGQTRNISVRR